MNKQLHTEFFIDDWRVSPAEGLLTRGNETERLEPKAMEVLAYLASHPGEVVTREALERDVWHGALVGYDAVTSTVIKLRKALQDNARQPRYIATIPKKGYQLIASITYPEDDDNEGPVAAVSHGTVGNVQQAGQPHSKQRAGLPIAALTGVVILLMVWLWPSEPTLRSENNIALPSIVVLPFENLGDNPKQEYLADGITEDIITDLSRISNLLVIASNTSSQYKGRQVTPEKVGTDLNIEYVLKGSIRQLGDEIRVNAQLVNAKTGFNTWAQRYDRKVIEVFAVQDEVTHSIVEALAVKMTNQEKQRLAQKATNNLRAYDFFQEGQRLFKSYTKETNEQARAMYRKAIELDPGYGRAYGALAVTLVHDYQRGWTDSPIETLNRALLLAEQAVTLDNATPQTYWALGFVYLWRKEYDKAERATAQSISIAPNYADGYGLLSLVNSYHGQAEKAIELNNKAISLNPYYTFEYLISYGVAYYTMGDYDAAIAKLEQAQDRNENAAQVKLLLAASYVKAGRLGDAEWTATQLQILNPAATMTSIEKTTIFSNPELKRTFLVDLHKAGLPE